MKLGYTSDEWKNIVKAGGLVFGDIGTSPIYTLSVIILFIRPTPENIMGAISLIVWTMILLVFIEYAWLAMKLDIHGEGGTVILQKILGKFLKPGRKATFFTFLAYAGVSLLLGDGVITPAISILSAVEGIALIPGLEGMGHYFFITIAIVITIGLFVFQSKGTDRVAGTFGPIMVVWFIVLAVSGIVSILQAPEILKALNPVYCIYFFRNNGFAGFLILSEVILCATGAEALYADMGHLGKVPIVRAWNIAFVCLVLNYLGQGAFVLTHENTQRVLFSMVQSQSLLLYIPFLILTIMATVIASQALISGVFSVIYQGINTRIFPRVKVDFTSYKLKTQIYISSINWMLMVAVIFITILFQKSENLAAAYGLAVTGTMSITGIIMIMIYFYRKERLAMIAAVLVSILDIIFLVVNLNKLSHGGYWSLVLASIPMAIILIWIYGNRAIMKKLHPIDFETFLISYKQIYEHGYTIPGTCIFFVGGTKFISPYVVHCMIRSNIIYEKNIFISVFRTDAPFGLETRIVSDLGPGLQAFEITAGYMQKFDINKLISKYDINPKVIFYGTEDIATKKLIWKVFSIIKILTPNFVQFYKLPTSKLQGVITRVEM